MATNDDMAAEIEKLRGEIATLREIIVSTGLIASGEELEGQYGDPPVRFVPRGWHGENYKNVKFSECSAEFLDFLAGALANMAAREQAEGKVFNGKPSYINTLRNAAKARGWSMKIKAGGGKRDVAAPPPALAAGSLFGGGGLTSGSSPFGSASPFGASSAAPAPDFDDGDDDGIPFIVNMTLFGGDRP